MNCTKYIKRFLKYTAGITCVLAVFLLIASPAFGASVFHRPQKHIYLVLDDSSSMKGPKNADANYALQTLIAMTDKNDTIDLYFLNHETKIDGAVDLLNKSDALLENIKINYAEAKGYTPFAVVTKAADDLKKKVSLNDEGEYWLVIITDGDFTDIEMPDAEKFLMDFASEKLRNGELPQLMCVGIKEMALEFRGYDLGSMKNVYLITKPDPISAMNEAAIAVSERIEIKKKSFSSDNRSVTFDSGLPAKNIIVLTQNAVTSIKKADCKVNLNLTENYKISHPEPTKSLSESTVCFVTQSEGKSIPAGKVTFEFSAAVSPKNTLILIEPDIGLSARFYNGDGGECEPETLRVNEHVRIAFSLCDASTKEPIDDSLVEGIRYSAIINGNTYSDNDIDFTIEDKTLDVVLNAKFEDGYELSLSDTYENLDELRILTLSLSEGGVFKSDIKETADAPGVTAVPKVNGTVIDPETFKNTDIKINANDAFKSRFSIERDTENSQFIIHPKGGLINYFTPEDQDVEVTVTLPTGEATSETLHLILTGKRSLLPVVILTALILFAVWCIIAYIIKFKKGSFPIDLQLWLYSTLRTPVRTNSSENHASILKPGVIDFWSALPFNLLPFKIRLGRAFPNAFPGVVIEASGFRCKKAKVYNVKEFPNGVAKCYTCRRINANNNLLVNGAPNGYAEDITLNSDGTRIIKKYLPICEDGLLVGKDGTSYKGNEVWFVKRSTKKKAQQNRAQQQNN